MRLRYSFALICISLTACGTTSDPSTGRFLVNDVLEVVSPDLLKQIRSAWKNDAMAIYGDSKAGRLDAAWTIDFIANTEARGVQPCTELRALEKRALPLKPFSIFDNAAKLKRDYSPREYYEAWIIDACGKSHEWRVFDDPADQSPHTVVLWSSERIPLR